MKKEGTENMRKVKCKINFKKVPSTFWIISLLSWPVCLGFVTFLGISSIGNLVKAMVFSQGTDYEPIVANLMLKFQEFKDLHKPKTPV